MKKIFCMLALVLGTKLKAQDTLFVPHYVNGYFWYQNGVQDFRTRFEFLEKEKKKGIEHPRQFSDTTTMLLWTKNPGDSVRQISLIVKRGEKWIWLFNFTYLDSLISIKRIVQRRTHVAFIIVRTAVRLSETKTETQTLFFKFNRTSYLLYAFQVDKKKKVYLKI